MNSNNYLAYHSLQGIVKRLMLCAKALVCTES